MLLAYLAVRNVAVPRVELAALLWGDRPEARARQSLRQALLGLKREIRDGLDVSTDVVRLLPGSVRLDLHDLEADLASGRVEAALARRTGDFLENTESADVEPLASWVRSVRIEIRRSIAAAVDATALARLSAGDADAAVACAAAACAHFPLDEPFHRLLLEMLDEAGRTAEAIATAESFATRLAGELDVEPSATFRALEAGLHKRAYAKQQRRSDQRAATVTSAADASEPETPAPTPEQAPAVGTRPRTWIRIAAAVFVLAVLFAALPSLLRQPADATSANARIAVMPFEVRGNSEFSYLGEGIVDLVSAGLEGAGPVRAVDPRSLLLSTRREPGAALDPARASRIAKRFSAGNFVLGSVTEVGGRIQLSASIYSRDGELERSIATAAASEGEIPRAVDELIRLILAAPSNQPAKRITSVAALTTESLPALKAFLQGEAHYRRSEYAKAVDAYKTAVAADSMFALAHFRLSLAAGWIPEFTTIAVAAERTGVLRDRLPENDRKLLEAFLSDRRGEFTRPMRLFREILAQEPHNLDAWYAYAELLFHRGPAYAHDLNETIAAFEHVLTLDPADGSSRVHLARLAALMYDREMLSRLFREMDIDPSAEHQREIAALYHFAVENDPRKRDAFLRGLSVLTPQEIWDLAWYTSSFARDPAAGAQIAAVLTQPHFEARWRHAGHAALAHFAAARGRVSEMKQHIAAFQEEDPDFATETRAILAMQPLLPLDRAEASQLAADLRLEPQAPIGQRAPNIFRLLSENRTADYVRVFMAGMVALRAQDTLAANRISAQLRASDRRGYGGFRARAYGHEIRAWMLAGAGRPDSVAELLRVGSIYEGSETAVSFPSTPNYSNSARRFLRGETALALGKPEEAVRWYNAIPDALGYEAIHVAPAELRMGQAYDRMGDEKAAARHYSRFIALWRECDPELRPIVEYARRRLAANS